MISMRRVDPEENMDRWYMVTVQATLLEPVAVVIFYGATYTAWQRMRIFPAASTAEAHELAAHIVESKLKRGYKITT